MKNNRKWHISLLSAACALAMTGCFDGSSSGPAIDDGDGGTPPPTGSTPPAPYTAPSITSFAPGDVSATIRRTDFGVPFITADSLEGVGFGTAYAFAEDNICVLADQIVRFNGQRAMFFGPDAVLGSGDSKNVINDFIYKALDLRGLAEANIDGLSDNSKALLQGYAAGYNAYLAETGVNNIALPCQGRPHVRPITEVDMMTYALGVALLPGAANFLDPMFIAVPPGEDYNPTPVMAEATSYDMNLDLASITPPDPNPSELGSNGWALGSDMTENGQGMLLANPHFPHVGNQRFWRFGVEIPGEMKVVGGSLSGMPGPVNIGFNANVAWTHTFSTAERFLVYQLELDPSDETGKTYLVDGEPRQMEEKNVQITVATGPGTSIQLERTFYMSDFGPLLSIPGQFQWGMNFQGTTSAFALYDANLPNFDVLDHWLALNLAESTDEIYSIMNEYTGIIFNNIMATDKDGNTFYMDGSTVPDLSPEALDFLRNDPVSTAVRIQAPFTLVPGNSEAFMPRGTVPATRAPMLQRTDFVQNSNNSYWLTNPDEPLATSQFADSVGNVQGDEAPDYLLYGRFNNEQTLRSRMGQKKLSELSDVTLDVLEETLLSNRAYLGEAVLDDLIAHCTARGTTPVTTSNGNVDVSAGCTALGLWDGRMNKESVGAVLFREFAQRFATDPQWVVPFDRNNPTTTPNTLDTNETVLVQLAQAIETVQAAGFALDAPLGDVQFVERSNPDGTASGNRLPWGGANNIEGGFNVFRSQGAEDGTLLPRHRYDTLPGSQLAPEGYHITSGSSWMFVMRFTENGPEGRGLLTYSQSSDVFSPHYLDQTQFYSQEPRLSPIRWTEEDIAANTISTLEVSAPAND
ncbi:MULTISPECIES: penicillin acylase family protein [Gammaproteobacteria]|uniref:penicillin acylase family protein n=1 Tax=Gammaproteobacteria TaxID=1236 RepID=UPI000DCF892D|nr:MULTISPECIES: penicillin acylase family protein [Gammaproteobacteria]RTE86640.1 acylase [Aliidiomarina sp. B3213]TCZ90805.1 acylase [Lysobacter sp. N42]